LPRIISAEILTLLKSHYKSFLLKNAIALPVSTRKLDFKFVATNTCISLNPKHRVWRKQTPSLHLLKKKAILTFLKWLLFPKMYHLSSLFFLYNTQSTFPLISTE